MTVTAHLAKLTAAIFLMILTLSGCGKKEEERSVDVYMKNGIVITPDFIRQPATGAIATAGYLGITATYDDKLLKAYSPLATVEIHEMAHHDGRMMMRPVESLELTAGETVTLEPGGLHLMFINPDDQLRTVKRAEITLTFEKAGDITVTLPVEKR